MFKTFLILLLSFFLLFSCTKKNNEIAVSEPDDTQKAINIYTEAVESLKKGDAFYAGKKFREVETMNGGKSLHVFDIFRGLGPKAPQGGPPDPSRRPPKNTEGCPEVVKQ